jgi:hypothetical protein
MREGFFIRVESFCPEAKEDANRVVEIRSTIKGPFFVLQTMKDHYEETVHV